MAITKKITGWEKRFRKKFVKPSSGLRVIDANNEEYIIGKAEDAIKFIAEELKRAKQEMGEALKIFGALNESYSQLVRRINQAISNYLKGGE